MTDLVPKQPWDRITNETSAQYAWFTKYCEIGVQRTPMLTAKAVGVPVETIRRAYAQNNWDVRASSYDLEVTKLRDVIDMDEAESLHAQYVAGMMMLKLGVTALKYKNPSLLKMKDIRELMQFGSEMARRGAGVADLKVDHTTTRRVDEMWADLLGEEVE